MATPPDQGPPLLILRQVGSTQTFPTDLWLTVMFPGCILFLLLRSRVFVPLMFQGINDILSVGHFSAGRFMFSLH